VPRAARSACSAASPAAARTFRGQNHLQQFIRVFKKISQLVALRSQRFRGQLRSNFYPGD
jgi:hypothetical protein